MQTEPPSSPGPGAGSLPPPGWYVDPAGAWRWWDGTAWGAPAAPAAPGTSTSRTLAILSHLGMLLGGFVLPLVIYLTADRRDRFLRHHASEGLNFTLTVTAAVLAAFALLFGAFVVGAVGASGGSDAGFFAFFGGFFLVWAVVMALQVGGLILGIVGAVKANQGEWWRYPVCIRFVKGAVDPATDGDLGTPVA